MEYHEYANLFPLMAGEEYAALVQDIRENGLLEPVIVYENKILDGRNRYQACMELGIEPRLEYVNGNTNPLQYVISRNLHRRHLNESQRAVVAGKLANMNNGGWRGNQWQTANLQSAKFTQPEAAEMLNVSPRTVATIKAIEKAAPEFIPMIERGEITANKAWTETRRKETIANLESVEVQEAKAVEGVYDTLVIDPPWPIEKIEREERPNQVVLDYPVMTIDEIKALELPAADNCHVWLWTTEKFLPIAFEIMREWGAKYVCTFVWHKAGGYQPFGLPQYNVEFALYGRIGSPQFIDLKDFKVCFEAPRGKHSEKPEEFYELVRRVTAGRRLDMFNRRKIDGFDGWGKEA